MDQQIDKISDPVQFYSFKDSTKELLINNLKAFSSVNSEIQQNTHCLLTVSRISSTIFQKVRMTTFVQSLAGLFREKKTIGKC